ncbi:MAG TPA: sigma-54-dependent Fis family transcriptional regulator, partial [Cupriavidus sp.]|nr:sigma-54-dependent Fis family transcriptional regulator [Cupriavidus sp.]
YHWPGNIRQLANLLRTAQLMAEGSPEITEDHLPDDFLEDWRARHAAEPNGNDTRPSRLADIESMAILTALKAHDGNISATAKALGVSRNTVYRRIEEAGGLPPQSD